MGKSVCIIPARGGSKRIPNKNIRPFCGKPMIQRSIEVALESRLFEDVVVSTDSEEIIKLSVAAGAKIPFIRPAELADEMTGTVPVIRHAIQSLKPLELDFQYVCCLYATAPFVSVSALLAGYELLNNNPEKKFAFPVTTFPSSIFRGFRLADDRSISMFWPENEELRSQDLPEAYHDAGQFYWGTPSAFMSELSQLSSHSLGLVTPRHLVQDIDTEEDWEYAETLFRVMNSE